MTMDNEWSDRFLHLDDTEIRTSTRYVPKCIRDLDNYHVEIACKKLEVEFNKIFVPTDQTVNIIKTVVNSIIGHCITTYGDKKVFLKGCYAKDPPLPDLITPICLTGLAGVGKTALINAIQRLLPESDEVVIDGYHPPFQRIPGWFININDTTKLSTMLSSLLEVNSSIGEEKIKSRGARHDIDSLRGRCRHRAYMSGVPLLVADEFQFITRSENANSLVSKILMTLSTIGVPFMYVANYSLVHRLAKRPQEDRQRLLSHPIVLLPEEPNSSDWTETLKAYRKISPSVFNFDPVNDAMDIYRWTAGIKRLLKILLIIGYRRARQLNKNVTITDLEWAFLSPEYSINRQDILLLNQQYITNDCGRKDLSCPIELPDSVSLAYKNMAEEENMKSLVSTMVEASLTHEERVIYKKLQKAAFEGDAEIIPISGKRARAINNLKFGEELLMNSLKDKKPK